MTTAPTGPAQALPYRRNVGAALFNKHGKILIARRADMAGATDSWQLPQGGIDEGEDPRKAVLRELAEELGTDRADIIGVHPEWLSYDLPAHLIGIALGGRYRGQTQLWFALRFTGEDADIDLGEAPHAEFDAWRWADLATLPDIAVSFRRPIYTILAQSFAPFAGPVPGL